MAGQLGRGLLEGAFAGLAACGAWASWASEHSPTPASLPIRPGGRVVSSVAKFLGAVFAGRCRAKGE